jgi:inosine/xanthosine triphosphate pyrophosphatase family protein
VSISKLSIFKPQKKFSITIADKRKIIKKVKSKYKICDPTMQHVHALRLNPGVYARDGEKYSDVAHLLNQCNGKNEA